MVDKTRIKIELIDRGYTEDSLYQRNFVRVRIYTGVLMVASAEVSSDGKWRSGDIGAWIGEERLSLAIYYMRVVLFGLVDQKNSLGKPHVHTIRLFSDRRKFTESRGPM